MFEIFKEFVDDMERTVDEMQSKLKGFRNNLLVPLEALRSDERDRDEPPPAPHRPLVKVGAALLRDGEGRVFAVQRPEGKYFDGQWEFPGGKVQGDEHPFDTVRRELKEELSIDVVCDSHDFHFFTKVKHFYEDFDLEMTVYNFWEWKGAIVLREGQPDSAWLEPHEMYTTPYNFVQADRKVIRLLQEEENND